MTTRFRITLLVVALALWATLPAAAVAAPHAVPPGVSGATQYTETLPGPGGEEATTAVAGQGKAASPKQALGTENAEKLEALGPEGKAAAALAAAGAPGEDGGHGGGGAGGRGDANGSAGAEASGSSPVGQVLGQVTGSSNSGGMGLLLPLLIVMAIVVACAYLFGRRRSVGAHD